MIPGTMSPGPFALRTLLWLPACFAAWYWTAALQAGVAGGVARLWVEIFGRGLVTAIEREGSTLVFVTALEVRGASGQVGVLLPEVNSLLYTYGLAFFVALMLAARSPWWKVLAGAAVLLPFQGWGIAFDLLAQLGVMMGPEVSAKAGFTGWRGEAVILGYQMGTLLFPTLVPVIAWGALNPHLHRGWLARHEPAGASRPRDAAGGVNDDRR